MDSIIYIILLIVLIVLVGYAVYLIKSVKDGKKEDGNQDQLKQVEQLNDLKSSLNQSFGSMQKEIAKDMTGALTRVDEKVGAFNRQVEALNKSQENFSQILAGVKKYGTLAEFSLGSILKDLLPASQYVANMKMKPEETGENVEFAVKLQDGVMVPVDSHWPVEKFKAIEEAHQAKDKKALADARDKLASAFRAKAKKVNEKYIVPPKTTDFAIVYAPTEGLFSELTSYQDPSTKELLTQELMRKHKVTILGPNTLSAYLQSLHMGFQTLKVQKHATQIHDDLKNVTSRFNKHFDGIVSLRKTLEEALNHTDDFGRDARSIMRTLENIKNPDPVEKNVNETAVSPEAKVDKIKSFNK